MRKLYLGPYQVGTIEGLGQTINAWTVQFCLKPIDVQFLIFGALLQAGVDRFEISEIDGRLPLQPLVAADRLVPIPRGQRAADQSAVFETFSHYLPSNWNKSREFQHLWPIQALYEGLLTAARRRSGLVLFTGLPDLDAAQSVAPLELIAPTERLISSIQSASLVIPSIAVTKIDHDAILRYREVLEGASFRSYQTDLEPLQNSGSPRRALTARIRTSAQRLQRRYPDLLSIERTRVGVLRPLAAIIDSIAGKLSGDLATGLIDALEEARKKKTQVLIYDTKSTVHRVIEHLMLESARKCQIQGFHPGAA